MVYLSKNDNENTCAKIDEMIMHLSHAHYVLRGMHVHMCGGGFFLACKDLGECSTIHSPPALLFFFFLIGD